MGRLTPSGRRRLLTIAATAALSATLLTGCGPASGSSPGSSSTTTTDRSATTVPLPAGKNPSEISKMVCAPKSQQEIATVLGVTAHVAAPTWTDHTYTCRFVYSNGVMVLSVDELSSWAQTYAHFSSLGSELGDTGSLRNLGQGAFQVRNGSVVVRKDWKVLLVDVSRLPANFGVPPTTRGDVAFSVADLILGCWAGD